MGVAAVLAGAVAGYAVYAARNRGAPGATPLAALAAAVWSVRAGSR